MNITNTENTEKKTHDNLVLSCCEWDELSLTHRFPDVGQREPQRQDDGDD